MTSPLRLAALAATLAAFTAGCATYTGQTSDPDDPNRTRQGALIGAAIGAAAGLLSGGDAVERRQRAMVGAGIGALAGGGIGAYQDRQEAELRRETAGTGIDVTRDGDVIKLNLPDGVTFDFARHDLKPQFYPALNTIASTLKDYDQTIVEVSGHTDSIGSDAANQILSERRANAVSSYLIGQGVVRERFEVVGMGERYPVAGNDTDPGRALNRRVEIRLLPLQG
ncbi:OmpA family protein [Thermomonas sp.]|jgi:outer membrane protein OmpA-like peptidoglycan-associated protein|uniref:OmpA family protein n=1 Tax=Thermomonas sp. TaxID=1971895 RepID=UPI001B415716|nr:OmpA family protein [Thermomonas sp.]MBK6332901.1 OmpA family protein [Thermomonas sp.]MBK6417424.1 OmpA family protein [Thermomonas sp.]MBK7206207.1 OmpA family protein [Thermomonas sp.]MBK9668766.1 OmpA family protein [Thermomonas sp.]MBL0227521.1 OmpA family protein [Thermomonas sp.]